MQRSHSQLNCTSHTKKRAAAVVIHLSSYIFTAFRFLALPIGDKHALKMMALR